MSIARDKSHWMHAAAAAAFLIASAPNMALMAQGLDAEGAIDAIVGSDVTTGEEAEEARVIAAIENTPDSVSQVRTSFSVDSVEIIFLPDVGEEQTEVEAKMEEFQPQIAELRNEIQGSAIFYHAIDSHSILINDVIALEFDDDNGVTIFVAGREPGGQVE